MTEIERAWILAASALVGMVLLGYLLRRFVLVRLVRLFAMTSTNLDDMALVILNRHEPLWFLILGVVLGARFAPISPQLLAIVDRIASVAFILSLSVAAASFATGWLKDYSARSGAAEGSTTVLQYAVRIVVVSLGGALVLANLGISITPILTALGVGSLAIALALQPTLSNFFAGIHLAMARPIRVGDFILLEGGNQGFVVDIGWRATRIRELPNNIIVVPNQRIVDMVLTNYSQPEQELSVLVQVGVSYGSDLARVERITIEVAKETLGSVQGGVPSFEPFIRYHTFGNSSIDFSVILRGQTFVDRFLLTHEFIKRLKERYDREGIEIPFPQRVVHLPGATTITAGAGDRSAP